MHFLFISSLCNKAKYNAINSVCALYNGDLHLPSKIPDDDSCPLLTHNSIKFCQ